MSKFMALFVLTILSILPALPVHSQTPVPPASASCDGTPTIVRVSEVKPGMMPDFLKAVDAHRAWYRSHGFTTNQIYALRVYDRAANRFSETEALTFHINPPSSGAPVEQDDSYKAFVKMYRDSSTLKDEYHACAPRQP